MADKKSVYIETTIPSYATAKASRDIFKMNRQILTRFFWENERQKYDLYISQYVIQECRRGDSDAAKRRLDLIEGILLLLLLTPEVFMEYMLEREERGI